jgi:hypothetical protein
MMLGDLHIEMAALKAAGHWLLGSGWTDALVHCGVATRGTAESYLNAFHAKLTRYAHQVFVSALFIMQRRAFVKFQKKTQTLNHGVNQDVPVVHSSSTGP